jgi:hypothetical protein
MAGDWIKMRTNLWDDPRVSRLADATRTGEATVIGGLYWLWSTADQHSVDGRLDGYTLAQVDRKTGIKGFGRALVSVGWLAEHEGGVTIPEFNAHNGASAKRRATETRRKESARAGTKGDRIAAWVADKKAQSVRTECGHDADKARTDGGQAADDLRAREEKRRDSKTTPSTGSSIGPAQPSAGVVPAGAGQVNPEPPDPRASADPALVAMVDSLRVTPGVGTDDHEAAGALWAVLAANSVRGTAQHPQVIEWVRMGVTAPTLRRAITEARKSREGQLDPAYLAPIVERILAGGDKPKAGQAWATDERACEAKARELGLWPARAGESWDGLRNRIRAALTKRAEEATR